MSEIDPCPLCSGIDVSLVPSASHIKSNVICNDCNIAGPLRKYPEEAIDAWNELKDGCFYMGQKIQ